MELFKGYKKVLSGNQYSTTKSHILPFFDFGEVLTKLIAIHSKGRFILEHRITLLNHRSELLVIR